MVASIIASIDREIANLQYVRSVLAGSIDTGPAKRGRGRPKGIKTVKPLTNKPKRTLSEAAKAKIAEAQKKRWAAKKAASAQGLLLEGVEGVPDH